MRQNYHKAKTFRSGKFLLMGFSLYLLVEFSSMKYRSIFFILSLSLFLFSGCGNSPKASGLSSSDSFSGDGTLQPFSFRAPNYGEELYEYLWPNLRRILNACFSNTNACRITQREEEIIAKIIRADATEQNGKGLVFKSGRENPGLFDLDDQGQPRSAVTSNRIGDEIFINTDYFESVSWNKAIALLIHELAHHHGETNHAALDRMGLKVADYADSSSNKIRYPNPARKPFHFYSFSWGTLLTQYRYYATPQLVLDDGKNLYDISEAFTRAIPCPTYAPYPLLFGLSEAYWEETDAINALRVRATFDCTNDPNSGPQRMLNYMDVEMRIEFRAEEQLQGLRIRPDTISVQYHSASWRIASHFLGDNYPLEINQMIQSESPTSDGGIENIFRTRIHTSARANGGKEVNHCYGYVSWWNPMQSVGVPNLEYPVDSCTFKKVEDQVYDLELKITTSSFDPNNKPIFSRIGVHFEQIHFPQEGSPLFRLALRGKPSAKPQSRFVRAWFSTTPFGLEINSPISVKPEDERFFNFELQGSEEIRALYLTRKEHLSNGGLTRVRMEEALVNRSMQDPEATVTPDRRYPESLQVQGQRAAAKIKLFERGMGFANVQELEYQEAIIVLKSMQVLRVPLQEMRARF